MNENSLKNKFSTKQYKSLHKIILLVYILMSLVYIFREGLYKLDNWDHKDMVASLVGIIAATVVYFKIKKFFINEVWR